MSSDGLLNESSILSCKRKMGDEKGQMNQTADDMAIHVQDLSKCYALYDRPEDRLKQVIYPRLWRVLGKEPRSYAREFWAIKDVSFDVKKGETVGIIGRNGSGKSTLLQIIAGTLEATYGQVYVNGRVAALLELGSGFNPEFTGRENVYMNAAIQGLSHEETAAKFDDIAAFADIGNFLDQPIKTYSSGMVMRLAFAVNACIEPDILVVDEALGVGDAPFQAKCYKRLRHLVDSGKSVLFVSHDIATVRSICSRALWLKNGCVEMWGEAKEVSKRYERFCWEEQGIVLNHSDISSNDEPLASSSSKPALSGENSSIAAPPQLFETNPVFAANRQRTRMGTGDVIVKNFIMLNEGGASVASCEYNDKLSLHYLLEVCRPVSSDFILGIRLRDLKGNFVLSGNDISSVHRIEGIAGDQFIASANMNVPLAHEDYVVLTGIFGFKGGKIFSDNGAYDFTDAVIWDVIEEAAYISVRPCKIMPLAGPVNIPFTINIIRRPYVSDDQGKTCS